MASQAPEPDRASRVRSPGKVFVLTGTLTSMTREEATERARAARRARDRLGQQEDQLPRRSGATPAASWRRRGSWAWKRWMRRRFWLL